MGIGTHICLWLDELILLHTSEASVVEAVLKLFELLKPRSCDFYVQSLYFVLIELQILDLLKIYF